MMDAKSIGWTLGYCDDDSLGGGRGAADAGRSDGQTMKTWEQRLQRTFAPFGPTLASARRNFVLH
jgi:hypothetical protein